MIEILPGIATKHCSDQGILRIPIVAGLIPNKDILQALTDGATAISSSRFELDEVNEIMHDLLANQA